MLVFVEHGDADAHFRESIPELGAQLQSVEHAGLADWPWESGAVEAHWEVLGQDEGFYGLVG